MSEYKLSIPKSKIAELGSQISDDDYNTLSTYAKEHGVKLSCFQAYVGDITVIEEMIDDIVVVAQDFPKILTGKTAIVLELAYDLDDDDFATTRARHIIRINAKSFSDLAALNAEYKEAVNDGRFVKGTDWHAIIRHELGHVVANIYNLNPMSIAKSILHNEDEVDILDILTDSLSVYSTEYNDGRELISESFSGYYSRVHNEFANAFVRKCINLTEGGHTS